MTQTQIPSDENTQFARLLLDPEDYCNIVGVSLKNFMLGPRVGGVGGNEAQHRFWTRMRKTGSATKTAVTKFIRQLEAKHRLSFLSPQDVPPEVIRLGAWSIAQPGLRERGTHTLEAVQRAVLASDHLQAVVTSGGTKALASELRRVPKSRVAPLFHECASMLETTNRADLQAIMAPIHIFMASVFVFNLLIETGPDRTEGVLALHKLACGDAIRRGPRLALARWLDTAQGALGYETKSVFYAALSPHLDPENARIEWSKVASGRDMPPLDRLRSDLKRVVELSGACKASSDHYHRLDLGLCYCAFVARSYAYLQKQNVTKARKPFLLAAAEVEEGWSQTSQPA
ncbi:hypothetical protein SAMN04487859_1533 [Roseovarius lutimaris]|uniref:Uncharacterized protein n=1 Tax=Roseovarius lutimaris TaxID=1005928 RepID=A0A1I5H3X3_9RHOB|nr:hypothetical protein [Roseovarius lutimaris]SFO42945.1 hypothetical protein SAMN04487859_1533 [Roseovarius lutimaris]